MCAKEGGKRWERRVWRVSVNGEEGEWIDGSGFTEVGEVFNDGSCLMAVGGKVEKTFQYM